MLAFYHIILSFTAGPNLSNSGLAENSAAENDIGLFEAGLVGRFRWATPGPSTPCKIVNHDGESRVHCRAQGMDGDWDTISSSCFQFPVVNKFEPTMSLLLCVSCSRSSTRNDRCDTIFIFITT
jgi:hypothetical protein